MKRAKPPVQLDLNINPPAQWSSEQIRAMAAKGWHYIGATYDPKSATWSHGRWQMRS